MEGEEVPRLHVLLRIRPHCAESDFWTSSECKHMVQQTSNWSLYVVPIVSAFLIRRWAMQSQTPFTVIMQCTLIAFTAIMFGWYRWLLKLPPNANFIARKSGLLLYRVAWLLIFTMMISNLRISLANKPVDVVASDHLYTLGDSPSLLTSGRNVLYASSALAILLQGLCLPLAFVPQLIICGVCHVLVFKWHLKPAIHILNNAGSTAGINAICQATNEVLFVIEGILFGIPLNFEYRTAACAEHHTAMVTMFAICITAWIPVYVSYRLEWLARARYIKRLTGSPLKVSFPIFLDLLFWMGLVTTTWTSVVCYHADIMYYSAPF